MLHGYAYPHLEYMLWTRMMFWRCGARHKYFLSIPKIGGYWVCRVHEGGMYPPLILTS